MNSRSSRPTDAGTLIRAWRERLSPEDVGLDAGIRRRVQGLQIILAGRIGNTGSYDTGMQLWKLAPTLST